MTTSFMYRNYKESCVELCCAVFSSFLTNPPTKLPSEFGAEPKTPLKNWIRRINNYGQLDPFISLVALFYLHRLTVNNPQLRFSTVNGHRCFLVATILASKFTEDRSYRNIDWGEIGFSYYPLQLINDMEREFLNLLDYDLSFSKQDLANFIMFHLKRIEKIDPDLVISFKELDPQFDNILCVPSCVFL
ncbi:hypothetical protein P9112_013083 [Eukaryota sp. TZLM1-RC]